MGWPYVQDAFTQGPVPAESQAGEDGAWQQHPYGGSAGGETGQQRFARPERELADHGQAGREASDPGKRRRGSDAEEAASGRLRDAMTHAEHAPARGRLAGEREHRGGADARAAPGSPAKKRRRSLACIGQHRSLHRVSGLPPPSAPGPRPTVVPVTSK
jgi:hypothetical protein